MRQKPRSRLADLQPWILVLMALAIGFGWLLGRDACTRGIERTYGTLSGSGMPAVRPRHRSALPAPRDGGAPAADASDDDW